jgi:hypothetical protein
MKKKKKKKKKKNYVILQRRIKYRWFLVLGRRMVMTANGAKEKFRGKWLYPYFSSGTPWRPQTVELVSGKDSKWVNHRRGMRARCFIAVLTRSLKTNLYGMSLEMVFNRTSMGQVRTQKFSSFYNYRVVNVTVPPHCLQLHLYT